MNVANLKPGMKQVDLKLKVLSVSDSEQVVTSARVDHRILELEASDKSGSIRLVLWDEKILPDLKKDDVVEIKNGFVTSFKGVWRVNVGRYGTITKV